MGDFRDTLAELSARTGVDLVKVDSAARKKRGRRPGRAERDKRERERAAASVDKRTAERRKRTAERLDTPAAKQLKSRNERRRFEQLRERQRDEQDERQKEKREQKKRQKAARHLTKITKHLRKLSPLHADAVPKEIPVHLDEKVQATLADHSGRTGTLLLDAHPNKVASGILKRALVATGGLAGDSRAARRNRHLVATHLLLFGLGAGTNRRGDRYNHVTKGIPIAAMQATLRDPHRPGQRPARSTLSGTHRGRLKRNEYGRPVDQRTDP